MEKKKRRAIEPKWIALGCVAIVALYLITCPMMRADVFGVDMGECISISHFGKLELRGIDRVVVTRGSRQITITDQDLIGQVTDETRIATRVRSHCGGPEYCDTPHGWIDLYQGDSLVRSMEWHVCCDMVKVYEEDATHWLIPWWCKSCGGYVYLSEELAGQLLTLWESG